MTVAEMLERISSAELTEWKALFYIRHKEQEQANKELERKSKSKSKKGRR
ncbi:hypothetical protein [Ammoniphilus sp. YIM 78166]|nr:hypothetical protein [Ammoniphilus sp. YIM 78166]